MSLNKCILLLGSNVNNKNIYLDKALMLIKQRVGVLLRMSNRIETIPEGFTSYENVMNQKIEIETAFSPFLLLKRLKEIENELGRRERTPMKNERYTDREIDIDIISYRNLKFISHSLHLPHHRNLNRNFFQDLKFDENN